MQTGWLLPDKKIWIREDEVFVPATVVSRNDGTKKIEAELEGTSKKITQSFNNCYQRSAEPIEYEDMCNMNILNEPQILHNLKQRYALNKIYTKIGPTLIALNPYKSIESLYEKQTLMGYREKVKGGEVLDGLIPHVYLTAGGAYASLKHAGKKQAIVISGQSGAGKTQNTKYCMKFLTSLSHIHHHGEKHKAIQDMILECNPILQAFGNSKTVRNSNSSRFGKYVRLFINSNEQMTGARIQNYLLQKSRVTSVSKKERSFHIFYYLIHGAEREIAGLSSGEKYEYLESSGCLTAEGIDDKADFRLLKHSLEDVGFGKEDTNKIWMVLGAILLLGNLQFDNKENLVSEKNLCKYADNRLAERICKNLGLKINQLNDLLLQQKIAVGKEIMVRKFDKNQCVATKNTLAKALYGRVFDYLIQKINDKLWINKKDDRSISILDIFGFEIFDRNSFEQLCINFTNERLQQLYTKYVFENELIELRKDGLGDKVKDLVPPDNKALIELIEKRMGLSVFSLIDQKTSLGAAKDQDIVVDLRKMKHKHLYVDPEPNRSTFMILHTQNPVVYSIDGFRYKNQDSITQEIDSLINKLFPVGQGQEFKGKTLVTKFDKQLRALNEELESSELHFIRCIKPNQTKKADSLDERYALQQIKYLGVLQTIQIRKSAFPFRTSFSQFVEIYKDLVPYDKAFNKLSSPQQCMYILRKMLPGIEKQKNSLLIGKERIYLKDEVEAKLNNISLEFFKNKNKAASKIQKQFERYKNRAKLTLGLKAYLKRMKTLRRVVKGQIIKIQMKYFNKYLQKVRQLKKIEEQNKKKKKQELQREMAARQKQEQNLRRIKAEEQRAQNISSNKDIKSGQVPKQANQTRQKKEQFESVNKSTLNSSKMYDTVVYDSQKPLPEAILPTKPQAPEFKSSSLSQSYINHMSVVNEDTNVLVKGELRLPMYERKEDRIAKLSKIITHSFEDQDNQKEKEDVELDISASIDDRFMINSNTIKGELGHKIINFQYAAFFEKTLRKRKTFFGRSKDIQQTLKAKDAPISKSLILLPEGDQVKALQSFKLLLWIADSHKTQKIYQPIQRLIELMQNTSQNLRNQVFVQIIKQQNVQNEYSSIKMYQIMAIYLHIFRVEESFIFAYLSCLLERYEDPRTFEKIKEFITYLFARSLRHITSKQIPILYLPTQFQLAALMCKRQIPVSIYFSIGNCIIVKVQSFETLADIKERVLETAGINSKRILPQMIGFFEVMSFENEELQEIPLDDNRSVWDLLTYWDKAKGKFQQTNVKPPDFGLYFKIKFAYELTFDDQEGVELFYAQAYFDLFLGRLKIPLPKLLECSAMMKATQPDLDIDFIIPLWAVEDNKAKQQYLQVVNKLCKRYEKMSRYEIRFEFLRNCNCSPLFMSITFPTQGNTKLFVKPKRIYIVQNDQIIQEIGIRRVLRWGCDQSTLMLTVRDNNSQRVMTVKSQFAKIVGSYLSTSMKLIMAMKGNP